MNQLLTQQTTLVSMSLPQQTMSSCFTLTLCAGATTRLWQELTTKLSLWMEWCPASSCKWSVLCRCQTEAQHSRALTLISMPKRSQLSSSDSLIQLMTYSISLIYFWIPPGLESVPSKVVFVLRYERLLFYHFPIIFRQVVLLQIVARSLKILCTRLPS